ncbi:MAG: FAD-binding protein [Actinobacteria bacterium]|nr:FAD-binding protein [Actinomycetota bacterium]
MENNYICELEQIVNPENVITSFEERLTYSYDSTRLEYMPDVVVRVKNAEQISQIMKLANEYKIPVTPRGAATGLSGGCLAVEGGILLVMVDMNRIIDINPVDLLITVEAGVITEKVSKAVEHLNLFYPPDPGSMKSSTIGGNIAENAGGLRGLKYGVTKDYVNSIEAVLPTGEIVTMGANTVKAVTGYNLADLMCGSEGTLSIITRATLGLLPIPPDRISILAFFKDMTDAAKTVRDIVAGGVITATLEIVDNVTINAIEDFLKIGLDRTVGAMLLIEVDGQKGAIEAEADIVIRTCKSNSVLSVRQAKSVQERDKLWEARRAALSSLSRIRPSTILEDATVPRSRMVELVNAINEIAKKYQMMIGTFGHAGDGNLHPTILTDLRIAEEAKKTEKAIEEIFKATIALGGTLSGEHGIGITKAQYLKLEISKPVYNLMKNIKSVFDPNNILNPGKMKCKWDI